MMNLIAFWRHARKQRLWRMFDEWHRNLLWNSRHCPRCHAPAVSPTAPYCAECGARMDEQPAQDTDGLTLHSIHTDPAQTTVRPFWYVHHALEEGRDVHRAVTEYQPTRKVERVHVQREK